MPAPKRSSLGTSLRRPALLALAAVCVFALCLALIAFATGWSAVERAFQGLAPTWLVLCALATLLAFPFYLLAYRSLVHFVEGPRVPLDVAALAVLAGFGPYSFEGGFGLDTRVLKAIGGDVRVAQLRVLALGYLEWGVLAPLAWVCAVVTIVEGTSAVQGSLTWPWAIGVPVGATLALTLAHRARDWPRRRRGLRTRVQLALEGIRLLVSTSRCPKQTWVAWAGMTLYWACDIATLYGAARVVGVHLDFAQLVLGYATGYVLTRRTLPLGGAGITEALMTFALHWAGVSIAPAIATVFIYRVFTLVVPALGALPATRHIYRMLDRHSAAESSSAVARAA